MDRPLRIGWAFAGGGSKGAFEVGAMRILRHVVPKDAQHVMRCISTGSLTGLALARDGIIKGTDTLTDIYRNISDRDVYRKYSIPELLAKAAAAKAGIGKMPMSVASNKPLFDMILDFIGYYDFDRHGVDYGAGAVNLDTGRLEFFKPDHESFPEGVLASTAIPGVWEPVEIDGHYYVDGGVVDVAPIGAVLDEGVDFMFIVTTQPVDHMPKVTLNGTRNAFTVLKRVVDIINTDNFIGDVKKFIEVNEVLGPGGERDGKRYVPYLLVQPDEHLGSGLSFERDELERWMDLGRKAAVKAISENSAKMTNLMLDKIIV